MATPEGNSRRRWSGSTHRPGPREGWASVGGSPATVLGTLTIPGRPEQVSSARAFVSRTLSVHKIGTDTDHDTATLLTSEIVTNAIAHTTSGGEGGTVTIVVISITHGILVEVIDNGSAGAPVVKGDLYATGGHGLFLVQELAAQWGYLRNTGGTTVWFHLAEASQPEPDSEAASPQASAQAGSRPVEPQAERQPPDRSTPLRVAAAHSATA
jgi:anti-sigma regulatory factor (Ser/Thr protein kinase)